MIASPGRVPERPEWGNFELLVDRLSIDLREARLSPRERAELRARGRTGEALRAIYEGYLTRWLDADFYRRLMIAGFMRYPLASSLFIGPLARAPLEDGASWLYYLPHTVAAANGSPCPSADRVRVRPWWRVDHEVVVCRDSYRPDHWFDDVGFCGGQPEPTVPAPPRPGCGCGPLLLACTPPSVEAPSLAEDVQRDVIAEVAVTGAELLAHRPFEEILTTTSTWETGLVRMLYMRRELIGEIHRAGWSQAVEDRYASRLAALDVAGPGRWVEREGPYRGTGIYFTTIAQEAAAPTYRVLMKDVFARFASTTFESVRVDSHALLTAVGKDHNALRALEVHQSPMRTLVGCKNCHAPLDYAGGFLREFRTPLFGGYPTGIEAEGTLYLNGPSDRRGEGTGVAGLAALLARQPEIASTLVSRLVARYVGSDAVNGDPALLASVRAAFDAGHRVPAALRAILESRRYTSPVDLDERSAPVAAGCASPSVAFDKAAETRAAGLLIAEHCSHCHGASHRIDLSRPADAIPVETWRLIAKAVESGAMPPPDEDEVDRVSALADSFTLPAEVRRTLTQTAVRVMLADQPATPPPDRWSPSFAQQVSLLSGFGRELLPADQVTQAARASGLDPFQGGNGIVRKLTIIRFAHALCAAAVERHSWSRSDAPSLLNAVSLAALGRPASPPELAAGTARLVTLRQQLGVAPAAAALCAGVVTGSAATEIRYETSGKAARCD